MDFHRDLTPGGKVSAIIPAYNESATVLDVIRVAEKHPLIDEVIVVDDGSRDETAAVARGTSAKVISLSPNQGKGSAMDRGVKEARNEVILFLDADIKGFTEEILSAIVEPVISGRLGMFVAVRGRRMYMMNKILHFTPILGGERALTRSLWRRVPRKYKRNFQIEIALNFYAKKLGHGMGFAVMPGLTQVIKEKKRGLLLGFYQRLMMCADVAIIAIRIYVIQNLFGRDPEGE